MPARTRPRVALVAASLDILGGQGVQARGLVDSLTGDGYRVAFIAINPRFPPGLRWLRRVPYLRTLVNQALFIPGLARLAAADVVHVFSASYASFLLAPLPALALGRLLRKRVVLHYHSGEAGDHLANWGLLVHPWLKLAHAIVVPSEYLAGVFAGYGYRTRVIRNVVDLSRFRYRERQLDRYAVPHVRFVPVAPELHSGPGRATRAEETLGPRLLSTRNLEPYYRVDVILEAFALVKRQQPDATLTVAGYGGEEPRLRQLAADLGVEGIRFVGRVDPQSMPGVCDEADIFLNASVVDNQPVSILEAFAAGLPVVSTPTGDIATMVRHNETGLIVPPGDPAALAAAVLQLLERPGEASAMAQHARRDVTRYEWPAVRDDWAAVYSGGGAGPRRDRLGRRSPEGEGGTAVPLEGRP